MDFKDIICNKPVVDEYRKIDENNAVPFSHGMKHVKNVVKVIEKLTDALGIVGTERDDLLVAALLHDIGQADGRADHGPKGAKIARLILNGLSEDRLNKILEAIELHDQAEGRNELSLFTNLISFADKMDFTRERFDDNWEEKTPLEYRQKLGKNIYEHILDVDFAVEDGSFEVMVSTDGELEKADFTEREAVFMPKVIDIVKVVASQLDLMPKILVDGNNIL